MAEVILSQSGGAVGGQLLPQGISVLGQQISGQAIGQFIGGLAGSAIDAALFTPRIEGPRIEAFHITQSQESGGIPNAYGRIRLGGNVIWAARFREHLREEGGGKGGPTQATYSYSLSFAVGLCEGEIARVSRVWVNGQDLDLSRYNWRLYKGTEDQSPDPLIETIEGSGNAPAYRGLAYIVFEDMPLDDFGAHLPQLSFEVLRPAGDANRLENRIKAVNLIPASGEFAYATQIVRREVRLGVDQADNMHNGAGVSDFVASLDQLLDELPNLQHVNLIVGWFGTSVDCAQCEVRPEVESRDRRTKPWSWTVAGEDRQGAASVSVSAEGRPNYGGTPDDLSVKQAIELLHAHGLTVTFYPFLFMDSIGFPWRGRVSCAEGLNKTSAARAAIASFFGDGTDSRYRRFIRHYAQLVAEIGGVESFLIGSEMVGLTRVRDEVGAFPAVDAFVALAEEVGQILPPHTKVSYAADWTEYGAYFPSDGTGDVMFPLDDLWASNAVDFIGLDWYAPMSDWRDGDEHLDADSGWSGPHDRAYLAASIEAGEGYDWFYGSQQDRDAQNRSPIIDTAHGEDWIFRVKDVRNWWSNAHYARPGGVRSTTPTAWQASSKPVRFVEIGFAAADKSTNQPNVFFDPKSQESALPHYSNGTRDDLVQRKALEVVHDHWANDPMLSPHSALAVWAWDMRPYPFWPLNEEVWSDGDNWRLGHWLNGRMGAAQLKDVVSDICRRAGVLCDAEALEGIVSGYSIDRPMSARDALEALVQAYDINIVETESELIFRHPSGSAIELTSNSLVQVDDTPSGRLSHMAVDKPEQGLRLGFIDSERDFQPGVVISYQSAADAFVDISLPLVLDRDQAQQIVTKELSRKESQETQLSVSVSLAMLSLEADDRLRLENREWQIFELSHGELYKLEAVMSVAEEGRVLKAANLNKPPAAPPLMAPVVLIIDSPPLIDEEDDYRPLVFAAASPWSGRMNLYAGPSLDELEPVSALDAPSTMGQLETDMPAACAHRWTDVSFEVSLISGALSSSFELSVLNGANTALVGDETGWEILQFQNAELIGDRRWRLSRLLRGRQGTEAVAGRGIVKGAWFASLDGAFSRLESSSEIWERSLTWRAGFGDRYLDEVAEGQLVVQGRSILPWAPAHLAAHQTSDGSRLNWIARSRMGPDGWGAAEPLLQQSQTWQVRVLRGEVTIREWTTDMASALYPADWITVDFATTEPARIEVSEIGIDGRAGEKAVLMVQL